MNGLIINTNAGWPRNYDYNLNIVNFPIYI